MAGTDVEGLVIRAEPPCSVAGSLVGLSADEARRASVRAVSGLRELPAQMDPATQSFRFERLIGGTWELLGEVPDAQLRARAVVECGAGGGELAADLFFTAEASRPPSEQLPGTP